MDHLNNGHTASSTVHHLALAPSQTSVPFQPISPPSDLPVGDIPGPLLALRRTFLAAGIAPHQHTSAAFTAIQSDMIKDWIPHVLSPEEFKDLRRESAERLASLRRVEAMRSMIASMDTHGADLVFLLRAEYWARFCRTFRVNDLPTEIIINIFRFVMWSAPDPPSGIQSRLWLTSTCKLWRTITLEDSTVWSAIWFRDPPHFERALAWFERAGAAPLDLRINDQPNHKFTDKEMECLLDKLFTKISNIRMLIVIVEGWEPVLTVLDRLRSAGKAGVPLIIERFELHRTGSPYVQIGEGYQPTSFRQPIPLFGGVYTPTLKHFSISGVHIDWEQSVLTNLTTIDIRRIPLERSPGIMKFRDLLASSPALRKLCLDGAGPRWQPDDARGLQPIQLPELKILVIADFSMHYGFYVLSQIAAPKVRDLTLMNFVGEDYSPLFGLMTKRFPEVRILTIYSVEVVQSAPAGRTLVKWLESMPLLSYLRIANVQKLFLQAFLRSPLSSKRAQRSASSPRRCLCPMLSVLECQAVDPVMIADFGYSRKEIGVPLRKIYFTTEMANKITQPQYQALAAVSSLFILAVGGISSEEEELMK